MPLRGIKDDLHGRLACYKQDWTGGFRAGIRYELKDTPIFPRNLALCCLGLGIRYHHGAKISKLTAAEVVSPSPFVCCCSEVCSCLAQDLEKEWFLGCFRILAPTTYIFFASAIPVISFGEQLERNTGKWRGWVQI